MIYVVTARDWKTPDVLPEFDHERRVWKTPFGPSALQLQFGDEGSDIELSDEQVVKAIIRHGRAQINEFPDGKRGLHFDNDYD